MGERRNSGKRSLKVLSARLNACDAIARRRFSASSLLMEPVVISLPTMNESKPLIILPTLHIGFQDSGWKSDMDRHSFSLHLKRPCGVHMYTAAVDAVRYGGDDGRCNGVTYPVV